MSTGSRPQGRLFYFVMILALIAAALPARLEAQAPQTTQIADVVYRPDGTPAQGTVLITWPSFSTADGKSVAAGTMNVPLGPGGAIAVALVPNEGATPAGTCYTIVYRLSDGAHSEEYWSVPALGPTTIAAIRSKVVPANVAMQVASRQYVDAQLSLKASDAVVLHTSGDETATGDKTLRGALLAKNINRVRMADQFDGADWCAKLAAADADLGVDSGEIWVNQNAAPGACAVLPALGAHHTVRFIEGGNYVLSDTLSLPAGARLVADAGGHSLQQWSWGDPPSGAVLKYTGGVAGTPVLRVAGNDVTIEGVAIDCQNAASSIGLIYNSTATGYSGLNVKHAATYSCAQGLVIGDPSNSIADCGATPNAVGCHQADTFHVDYLTCYGVYGNTTDECLHLNAANGGQQSVLDHVYSTGMNVSIHLVRTNGGLEIRNHLAGSPQGPSPTQVRMEADVSQPIALTMNECEGPWTYAVHDSSSPAATTPATTWMNNAFNCPVLVDGSANITSISNGGATASYTVAGQALVQSLNDQRVWVASGNGKLDYRYIGNDSINGTMGIGGAPYPQVGVIVQNAGLTTANQKDLQLSATFSAAATTAGFGVYSTPATAAASFTMPSLYHFYAKDVVLGSGSAVSNQYGFFCTTLTAAGTNNCFYNAGAAPNNFGTGISSGAVFNATTGFRANGAAAANTFLKGNGTNYVSGSPVLASADFANQGTATTVLHGNAAGNPSFGQVVSADLNITTTTCSNQFLTALSATAAGTCTPATLASGQFANQGTTTTLLHGNGSGNPGWANVAVADVGSAKTGVGSNFVTDISPQLGGTVGIGAAAVSQAGLLLQAALATTSQKAIQANETYTSAATSSGVDFYSTPTTAAAAFTMASLYHFRADDVGVGSGSAVATQYGFYCSALANATNNYCFFNNSAAPNNFGTGNNAFGGAITTYKNVATVGNGMPSFTGAKSDTGFSTTQAAASILATTVATTQAYRIGYSLWQATSGSGGPCNTNATATVAIGWTDPANQAHTVTEAAASMPPTIGAGTAKVHGEAATGYQSDQFTVTAKASTAITRTITWANGNCNTQPTASALFFAEALN